MIYITGDKHGRFEPIEYFCDKFKTTKDDVLIVLGDLGVNYYGGRRDKSRKKYLANMPITIFAIRGNHERRPSEDWDKRTIANENICGSFIVEPGYDSILYAQDGRSYGLNTQDGWKQAFVIGGAYSVDKYYRIASYEAGNHNLLWFEDEQLSPEEMAAVKSSLLQHIENEKKQGEQSVAYPDYILSHTCPLSMEPTDMFLPQIDQSTVDTSTEVFLDDIKSAMEEKHATYKTWFCGHWHTDRVAPDNFRFMFNDFIAL